MANKNDLPDWWVKNYPQWKMIAWRALRTFVATFIPTFCGLLATIDVEKVGSKEALTSFIVSCIVSSLSAAITALGKVLRDRFVKDGWIQKIPV